MAFEVNIRHLRQLSLQISHLNVIVCFWSCFRLSIRTFLSPLFTRSNLWKPRFVERQSSAFSDTRSGEMNIKCGITINPWCKQSLHIAYTIDALFILITWIFVYIFVHIFVLRTTIQSEICNVGIWTVRAIKKSQRFEAFCIRVFAGKTFSSGNFIFSTFTSVVLLCINWNKGSYLTSLACVSERINKTTAGKCLRSSLVRKVHICTLLVFLTTCV